PPRFLVPKRQRTPRGHRAEQQKLQMHRRGGVDRSRRLEATLSRRRGSSRGSARPARSGGSPNTGGDVPEERGVPRSIRKRGRDDGINAGGVGRGATGRAGLGASELAWRATR